MGEITVQTSGKLSISNWKSNLILKRIDLDYKGGKRTENRITTVTFA